MAVVDAQLLSCFQEPVWRKIILCSENSGTHAEPGTDACERVAARDRIEKLIANDLHGERRIVLPGCVPMRY
jgi:hypothetical protein